MLTYSKAPTPATSAAANATSGWLAAPSAADEAVGVATTDDLVGVAAAVARWWPPPPLLWGAED